MEIVEPGLEKLPSPHAHHAGYKKKQMQIPHLPCVSVYHSDGGKGLSSFHLYNTFHSQFILYSMVLAIRKVKDIVLLRAFLRNTNFYYRRLMFSYALRRMFKFGSSIKPLQR